jgi:hypothetical protein
VVPGVFVECSAEMVLVGDEHAVGDLAAHGLDEPLRVCVRLWAVRRDLADGDAGVGQDGVECGRELAGPVPDQDLELLGPVAEVDDQVSGLLRGPRPVWVRRDGEDVQVSRFDLEEEEHVQPLQRQGAVDVEEVAGQHRGRLGGKKSPPGGVIAAHRCGWDTEPFEDAADRGRAHAVAEAP